MHGDSPRVLLISAPLTRPHFPNLAVEKLAEIARRSGIESQVFYSSLLLPRSLAAHIEQAIAPAFFSPYYYDVPKHRIAEDIAARASSPDAAARETLASAYLSAIDAVSEWLDRSRDWLAATEFDIAAFSVGFDAQRLPSAILAHHIKSIRSSTTIIFGGTACDDEMGAATLELFPEVDVVYQGEAESTFVDLVRGLAQGQAGELPPGSLTRHPASNGTRETPPYTDDFSTVIPDYSSFVEQRAASAYSQEPLVLLFESSRGCWWGSKSHCKFCGIRNVSGPYRRAQPRDVVLTYHELSRRHKPDVLYATDAILDFRHFLEVFATLGEFCLSNPAATLFYEVKPSLERRQLAQLAAAGVRVVQPGIESFATATLRKLAKGGDALQNIRFLRDAKTYSIHPVYGLLFGGPEETLEDVEDSIGIIELIKHLPPPSGAYRIVLHKNSPYAKSPETYGIDSVRPFWYQHLIYQTDDAGALLRLCYESDFSSAMLRDDELLAAHGRLIAAVEDWRERYSRGDRLLLFRNRGEDRAPPFLARYFDGEPRATLDLDVADLQCYEACASSQSLHRIAAKTGLAREAVAAAIGRLVGFGGVIHDRGRYLSVAEELLCDPWADSGVLAAIEKRVHLPVL